MRTRQSPMRPYPQNKEILKTKRVHEDFITISDSDEDDHDQHKRKRGRPKKSQKRKVISKQARPVRCLMKRCKEKGKTIRADYAETHLANYHRVTKGRDLKKCLKTKI